MPEFIARNGLIAQNNSTITGSLTVTAGITGSFQGTATTASYVLNAVSSSFATTASYAVSSSAALQAQTASKVSILDDNGNNSHKVTFVNTTVATSGEQLLIDPTATQFTYNPNTNLLVVTASLALNASSASYALTSSYVNPLNQPVLITGSLTVSGSITSNGTLTAQTLVVQTITSSVLYSSGSNVFGNSLSNTQQMTGSVGITGSLSVTGTGAFTNTLTVGHVTSSGTITMTGAANGVNLIGPTGNPAYFATDQSVNNSGTRWRFGHTGGIAGFTSWDVYNQTNNITPLTLSSTGTASFSGNVGIGTASPGQPLEIYSADGTGIRLKNSGSSDKRWDLVLSGNDFRINETGVTAAMTIKAGSDVGIGTTSPTAKLTVVKLTRSSTLGASSVLQISDASATGQAVGDRAEINFYTNSNSLGGNLQHATIGIIKTSTTGNETADLYFGTSTIGGSPVERMRITSGGNVGIGTDSPDVTGFGWKTLTIKGGTGSGNAGVIELQNTVTVSNDQNLGIIAFLDGTSRNSQISVRRESSTSTAHMDFFTNAGAGLVERMRITSDGYLRLAGAGIQFNGDTAAANALNDYEEGTWTAAFNSDTGSITMDNSFKTGRYTKIGRIVTIQLHARFTAISSPTGVLSVSGLPFTSASSNQNRTAGSIIFLSSSAPLFTSIVTYISNNTSSLTIAGFNETLLNAASYVKASSEIYIGLSYIVD